MFSWSKCLEKNPLFGLFPFIYIIKTIFFIPTITVRIATEQLLISENTFVSLCRHGWTQLHDILFFQ